MAVGEIVSEAARALLRAWPLWLSGVAAALGLWGVERRLRRGRARLHAALVVVAAALGLLRAWEILWLADDAFISFRYARNFARGLGLVYNQGEWVEGYTNFLWTLLLGLAGKIGLDIPLTALFGNLVCFVAAIVLVARLAERLSPGRPAVPFAALALALAKPFYTFASGGLETMPIALLAVAAVAAGLARRGELWAGLLLTASVMCRPDQILLYAAMGIALVAEDLCYGEGRLWKRPRPRRYVLFAAPFVLLYVPYFLWRWSAYGALLPNTFYAKSGASSYWSQGAVYLVHFLSTSGAWLWLPLLALALAARPARREVFRLRVYTLGSVLLLGVYVVRVGGDFMEYRFFLPLLPLVALCTEVGLRLRPFRAMSPRMSAAATAVLAVVWTPVQIIRPFEIRWHLAAEETYYQVRSLVPLRIANWHFEAGQWLHQAFTARGLSPRIAGGSIGMVGYFSDLPLFDVMGLTSRVVGNKEIRARGRPGHEKRATLEEILADGVVIDLGATWGPRWEKQTRAWLDGRRFYLVRYDPDFVAALSRIPSARLPDPAADIRELLESSTRSELLEADSFYRSFLDRWPEREALLAAIRTRLAAVADFEEGFPEGARPDPVFRLRHHRLPEGATGLGLLTSLGAEGVGEFVIPLRVEAPEIRLALGGAASALLGVELRVDGEVRARLHPSGGPGLAPAILEASEFVGREAELVVFDRDPRADVGVAVDAIHFPAPEGDLRQRIEAGGPLGPLLWEAERTLPPGDPHLDAIRARVAERYDFDAGLPPGAEVEGDAFAVLPAPGPLRRQSPLRGQGGAGLVNSYHPEDRGTGKIRLPWRELDGSPIHLLVGGGADCNRVYVGLEVEGIVRERVCGADDEVLRPAVLATEPFRGQRGRVVIVDNSRDPWGHILVDDVIFEKAH